jgi:hypothetical protein
MAGPDGSAIFLFKACTFLTNQFYSIPRVIGGTSMNILTEWSAGVTYSAEKVPATKVKLE